MISLNRSLTPWLSLLVLTGLNACSRPVIVNASSPVAVADTAVATATSNLHTGSARLIVRSCLPVGYGLVCRCDVRMDGQLFVQNAHIESSVKPSRASLYSALERAPFSDPRDGGAPVEIDVTLEAAPDDARYNDVLITTAKRWHVRMP